MERSPKRRYGDKRERENWCYEMRERKIYIGRGLKLQLGAAGDESLVARLPVARDGFCVFSSFKSTSFGTEDFIFHHQQNVS
jgi:hypothetical protein